MFSLQLNPHIGMKSETSVLEASRVSGLTYPTFLDMSKGRWSVKALSALARFLFGMGYTADKLRDCKFSEIFVIKEEG